ncbi:MAG: phage portal protein [Prevotellaceae bacterium]|jgi:hypothetical protein|nr:phage portal protein [Prevotellaceae bacterium]
MTFFGRNKEKKKESKEDCTPGQRDWFFPISMSGRENFFGHNYFSAYRLISQVRMVIDKRAECLASAVPYILDGDGNEPQGENAKAARKLFDTPNFTQSFSELYVLKEIYRLIYGWSAIYLFRGFPGAIPAAMFAIPPSLLDLQVNKNYLVYNQKDASNIVKTVKISGTNFDINFSDLIFFRDSIPNTDNPLISDSKMQAVFNEYDLAAAISEAEKTIVERRGALGILSKDINDPTSVDLFDEEREELQERYKAAYGMTMSKNQIIITGMALKWQQMALPVRDLMLIELGEEAQKRIAGVYDLPYNLLPGGFNSKYSDLIEAKKYLYSSKAIPTSASDAKKFDAAILEKYGLHLKLDYSDMFLFQDDLNRKATAVNAIVNGLNAAFTSGNITREEWRLNASQYIEIDPNKTINN